MSFYFYADILAMVEWVQTVLVGPVYVDESELQRQWPPASAAS